MAFSPDARFRFEKPALFLKDSRVDGSERAVVRDYRAFEAGRRRSNRFVLIVRG
jgi:hypothetical protein